jgi:N-hydroxyarylamine O-acetyltransferase
MDLDAYLARIGYAGPVTPTLETLDGVMRAHVAAIPFENIDVQLGRPTSRALPAIFDKLVTRRRGGWCYEQNGLLGWALDRIGFAVTPLAGGVMRAAAGDGVLGNHLALLVRLEEPFLVDAGFGGSLAAPIRLQAGAHRHAPYNLSLARLDDGYWRYEEQVDGKPFSFDFSETSADQALLDAHHVRLQAAPDSPFVLNLVAQRRVGDRHFSLRGRVLTELGPDGPKESLVDDADALVETLAARFALDVPEIAAHWPAICRRHADLFGP